MNEMRLSNNRLYIFIPYSLLLIGLVFSPLYLPKVSQPDSSIGYIALDGEGGRHLYLEEYDLELSGMDKRSCTYFFLPSYASITTLDQSLSNFKVLLPNGSFLNTPPIGQKLGVFIDTGEGEPIPWNICFMKSANLYTMEINTLGFDIDNLTHDQYINMSVSLISPDGDKQLDNEPILLKGRGNSTWEFPKKPYQIKFNKSTAMCGMTPSKKWALLSNFCDSTKLANKLAFDTSREIGMECSIESDWVDLYIDDLYIGNYLLCKEPNTEIKNLLLSPHNLDEAYLIEQDQINDPRESDIYRIRSDKYNFRVKVPDHVSNEQGLNIATFIDMVDESLRKDIELKASPIDSDSFAKRFIMEEFFFNHDSMMTSYYFYKKPHSSLLCAGPCWDYDLALGEGHGTYVDYTKSLLDIDSPYTLDWDSLLYDNGEYLAYLADVLRENIPQFKYLIDDYVDICNKKIYASREMDYIVWERGWYNGQYNDIDNNVRYIKFFLTKRLEWLCDRWNIEAGLSYNFSDGSTHIISCIMPDGSEHIVQALDGAQISPDVLPEYDSNVYIGWCDKYTHYSFSYFVPVFEDTALELRPLSE